MKLLSAIFLVSAITISASDTDCIVVKRKGRTIIARHSFQIGPTFYSTILTKPVGRDVHSVKIHRVIRVGRVDPTIEDYELGDEVPGLSLARQRFIVASLEKSLQELDT